MKTGKSNYWHSVWFMMPFVVICLCHTETWTQLVRNMRRKTHDNSVIFYEQCEPLFGDSQNNVYKQVLFLLFIRSVAQTNLNTGSLSFANFAQCKNGLSKHSRPKQQVSRSCSGGYSCNNSSLRGGRKSVLNL